MIVMMYLLATCHHQIVMEAEHRLFMILHAIGSLEGYH